MTDNRTQPEMRIITLGESIAERGMPTAQQIEDYQWRKFEDDLMACQGMTADDELFGFDYITGKLAADYYADARRKQIETLSGAPPSYGDVAALLKGELPEPPKPSLLTRADGNHIFYRAALNMLFGDPEAAKTWIAASAIAEELANGGTAMFIDMDHNGMPAIISRLLQLGAPATALADQNRFRYVETDDPAELDAVVLDCTLATVDLQGRETAHYTFIPNIVVLDCAGEIMAAHGKDSNNADEFTHIVQKTMRPLIRVGSGVVLIDHLSRSQASRKGGAGGTTAKRRIIDGLSVEARVKQPFVKGRGGITELIGLKDRHSGVREHSASMPEGRFNIGQFILAETDGNTSWHITPATADEAAEASGVTTKRANDYLPAALTLGASGAEFTARDIAKQRFGGGPVDSAGMKQARRGVDDLVSHGVIYQTHAGKGTALDPARYALAEAHLGEPPEATGCDGSHWDTACHDESASKPFEDE